MKISKEQYDRLPKNLQEYFYKGNFHCTCKPLALMRYLCRLVCPPNGTVLDPFAGSGTTLLAAQKEGFNFIGIEKEQEYCEIARRRVAQATTQRDVETEVSEGTLF